MMLRLVRPSMMTRNHLSKHYLMKIAQSATCIKPLYKTQSFRMLSTNNEKNWRIKYRYILEMMWEERKMNQVGFHAVCSCGGPSISFCECARKRFFDNVTKQELSEFWRTF